MCTRFICSNWVHHLPYQFSTFPHLWKKKSSLCQIQFCLLLQFSSHSKFRNRSGENRFDWIIKRTDSSERFVHESDITNFYKLCNMAADHIGELASMENSNRSARPGFCSDKHSLLVIVGQPGPAGFVELLVSEIERGKYLSYCGMVTEWEPARALPSPITFNLRHED